MEISIEQQQYKISIEQQQYEDIDRTAAIWRYRSNSSNMKISIEQQQYEDVAWVEGIFQLSYIVEDYCFSLNLCSILTYTCKCFM